MGKDRWLWIAIAAVLLSCLLLSCFGGIAYWGYHRLEIGGPEEAERPATPTATLQATPTLRAIRREGVLNLPASEPPTLDPALAQDATSSGYIVEIFSGLVTLNPNLEVVPDIAEKWEVSEDGTIYTFYIRQDVEFQDGKPVTAQDFKYAIERACDPTTGSVVADTYLGDIMGAKDKLRGLSEEVSGVRVIDDYTLEITIDAPKAYFLAKLTYPTAFVVDQENVEGSHQPWTDHPNGTGPFRLKGYRLGERIVLERNEHYYGEPKPALEEVNFLLAGGSAMIMYENGELDVTPVGLADIERVLDPTNTLNKELTTVVPTLSIYYIGFNVNSPPFDDVKVRQAFNYALDKEKIINVVMKKMWVTAEGILPPGMPGYNPELEGYPYDPEEARRLIAESKYEDVSNFPEIVLSVPGAGGAPFRAVTAVVEMYRENLGVEIAIEQMEWATFLDDLKAHRFQMFGIAAGWVADYPDPQDFLDILFHCESRDNNTEYCNPEVDSFLEEARVEEDHDKRMGIYQQVEKMILEDAPWVPIAHDAEYWLTKPYVKGMIYPPTVIPKFKYVFLSR